MKLMAMRPILRDLYPYGSHRVQERRPYRRAGYIVETDPLEEQWAETEDAEELTDEYEYYDPEEEQTEDLELNGEIEQDPELNGALTDLGEAQGWYSQAWASFKQARQYVGYGASPRIFPRYTGWIFQPQDDRQEGWYANLAVPRRPRATRQRPRQRPQGQARQPTGSLLIGEGEHSPIEGSCEPEARPRGHRRREFDEDSDTDDGR